jgi:hypothetical protein
VCSCARSSKEGPLSPALGAPWRYGDHGCARCLYVGIAFVEALTLVLANLAGAERQLGAGQEQDHAEISRLASTIQRVSPISV